MTRPGKKAGSKPFFLQSLPGWVVLLTCGLTVLSPGPDAVAQAPDLRVANGPYSGFDIFRPGNVPANPSASVMWDGFPEWKSWSYSRLMPLHVGDGGDLVAIKLGGAGTLALKADGSALHEITQPGSLKAPVIAAPELNGLMKIAAGDRHFLALRQDGTVLAWGSNDEGQCAVPPGLQDVTEIAAGGGHSLAVCRGGLVVAWGRNAEKQCRVPARLRDAVAVSAGGAHSMALTRQGRVICWGDNGSLQLAVPAGLRDVVEVAAGGSSCVARRRNGRVVCWGGRPLVPVYGAWSSSVIGYRRAGAALVPRGLGEVAGIAAGGVAAAALLADGRILCWELEKRENNVVSLAGSARPYGPSEFQGIRLISVLDGVGWAVSQSAVPSWLAEARPGFMATERLSSDNLGTLPLDVSRVEVVGEDAAEFAYLGPQSFVLGVGRGEDHFRLLDLWFRPTSPGRKTALLKIYSNDPDTPVYTVLIAGLARDEAMAVGQGDSDFTYTPLKLDRQTGLITQTVSLVNKIKPLEGTASASSGIKLVLSGVAPEVTVLGSSLTSDPQTVEVHYPGPVLANQIATFHLSYLDPKRRTSPTMQPMIRAEMLNEPLPLPPAVEGDTVAALQNRPISGGHLLEWRTLRNRLYVVNYSDDRGATWSSAAHLLRAQGKRLRWIDHGPPETVSEATYPAVPRIYQIKCLPSD